MKIVNNHWVNDGAEVSIADAITGSLDTDAEGELECIRASINKQAEMIGKIVEALSHSGLLTATDISNMLSWRYRLEDEE